MAKPLPPFPTEEQFLAFKKGLEALQPPQIAASLAGISAKQLKLVIMAGRSGLEPYAEFTRAIDKVHGELAQDLLSQVAAAARDGDWKAAVWLYDTKVKPAEVAWQKSLEKMEEAEDSTAPNFDLPSLDEIEAAEERAMSGK